MRKASKLLGIPIKVFSENNIEEQTNNYLGFSKENKRFSFEENGKTDYLELGVSIKEFEMIINSEELIEIINIPNFLNTFKPISSFLELNNLSENISQIQIIETTTNKIIQEIYLEKNGFSLYDLKSFYSIKILAKGENLKFKYIAKGV